MAKRTGIWGNKIINNQEGDIAAVFEDWKGTVPRYIKAGRNLKWLYEDLRRISKRISCEGVEVSVSNHNYENGKIPLMYLAVGKENSCKGQELEERLVGEGLIKHKRFKKDTPFVKRVGVKVLCFSYNVEDYGIV